MIKLDEFYKGPVIVFYILWLDDDIPRVDSSFYIINKHGIIEQIEEQQDFGDLDIIIGI